MSHPVTAGRVLTEGDELYYEIRGQGAPLLMISGGGGDAGFFTFAADLLADEFKVITYDRRGNSRSTRNAPQNFEISQQSRDAVAVIRAAGETSAYVFGNSGGAIIALDMVKTQPEAVRAAIAHEPPALPVLPDSAKWLRYFASLYWTAHTFGSGVAMLRFSLSLGIPFSTFRHVPEDFSARNGQNQDFFMKHELLPFSSYLPDVAAMRQSGVPVYLAAGQMTLDKQKFYGRTAPILAEQIGGEMVIFPGHHLSYFDMPEAWSGVLRGILRRENEKFPARATV